MNQVVSANGHTKVQSYTLKKRRTVGCRWVRHEGQWWKYWIQDFGGFYVETPAYFTAMQVYYTGRKLDDS